MSDATWLCQLSDVLASSEHDAISLSQTSSLEIFEPDEENLHEQFSRVLLSAWGPNRVGRGR